MKFSSSYTLHVFLFLVFAARFSYSGYVQTRNAEFMVDGSRFVFNGFNSYFMMSVASTSGHKKVSDTFRVAKAAGLTVCRTWAFSDGATSDSLQTSPGVYNENVFKGLDFVISEAKNYGIRLILALVNNYKDYGGRAQYCNWARSAGVAINSDDDFYNNTVIKGYYKNNANKVITRRNNITGAVYRDDPTIMAWELINEPRSQDISGDLVNGWLQEMASYVKSIDKNHLVGNGMEGFYGPNRKQDNPQGLLYGTDFISNTQIQGIDFASLHAYPDIWLSGKDENAQIEFMKNWMSSHWTDSVKLNKPLILGEFGKSSRDPGYSVSVRDTYMSIVYDVVYNSAVKGGFGGSLVWQIFPQDLASYGDGYDIVLSGSPSTAKVMAQQSKRVSLLK